jgi:hypothetical protein
MVDPSMIFDHSFPTQLLLNQNPAESQSKPHIVAAGLGLWLDVEWIMEGQGTLWETNITMENYHFLWENPL